MTQYDDDVTQYDDVMQCDDVAGLGDDAVQLRVTHYDDVICDDDDVTGLRHDRRR